jgi:hypothetical protein
MRRSSSRSRRQEKSRATAGGQVLVISVGCAAGCREQPPLKLVGREMMGQGNLRFRGSAIPLPSIPLPTAGVVPVGWRTGSGRNGAKFRQSGKVAEPSRLCSLETNSGGTPLPLWNPPYLSAIRVRPLFVDSQNRRATAFAPLRRRRRGIASVGVGCKQWINKQRPDSVPLAHAVALFQLLRRERQPRYSAL